MKGAFRCDWKVQWKIHSSLWMLPQTLLSHIISKAEVTSNQTEQKKDTIFWLGSSYPFSKSGSSEQNGKNLTWNLNLKEWVKKLCLFLCSILFEITCAFRERWSKTWKHHLNISKIWMVWLRHFGYFSFEKRWSIIMCIVRWEIKLLHRILHLQHKLR